MINATKKFIQIIGKQNHTKQVSSHLNTGGLSKGLFQQTSIRAESTAISPNLEAGRYQKSNIFNDGKSKQLLKWTSKNLDSSKTNASKTQNISGRDNSPIESIDDAFKRFKNEEIGVEHLDFDDVLQCAVTNDFDDSGLGRLLKARGYFQNGRDYFGKARRELEKAIELDPRVEKFALDFVKNLD